MEYCKNCGMPVERDPRKAEVDLYCWDGGFAETVYACDSKCEDAILEQNMIDNERARENDGVYV